MSYLVSGLVVVFGIAAILLSFRLLSGLIKTAVTAGLLALVIFGATTAALYQDYNTLRDGLSEDAVLIVTHDNESVTATNITDGSGDAPLDPEETNASLTLYVAFDALNTEAFTYNGRSYSAEQIDQIMDAGSLDEISNVLDLRGPEDIALKEQYSDADAFHEQVAIAAATSTFSDDPSTFLIDGLRDNTVRVEPPLLTARLINYMPDSITRRAIQTTA